MVIAQRKQHFRWKYSYMYAYMYVCVYVYDFLGHFQSQYNQSCGV